MTARQTRIGGIPMPILVTRFAVAGAGEGVAQARQEVVERVRRWGVRLDDDSEGTVRLVTSELVTNAVVHGEEPIAVGLYHRPGRLVIEVLDSSPRQPMRGSAGSEEEFGRGWLLVDALAVSAGWEPTEQGKRVWAQLELPSSAPAIRAAVLRQFFRRRSHVEAPHTSAPAAVR
ncbi:ATP-binding protein [Streptomyces noboritoensis]|uniref:ATP-binding protein n=1 Tax=Streptomyces noboritoensis TaxID=67337 RepID=A0ABV6TFU5_9ACTN